MRTSVASRSTSPATDETLTCAHPWCNKVLTIPPTGRRPRFCSDEHRKQVHAWARQEEARLAREAAAEEARLAQLAELQALAGRLVEYVTTSPRATARIFDWLAEGDGWERESMVTELLRFVRPPAPLRRLDESRRRAARRG